MTTPQHRKDQVIELGRQCKSQLDIALDLGMSPPTVGRILREAGIHNKTNRPTGKGYYDTNGADTLEKAKKLWDLGLSAGQIAERMGRPISSITGILSKAGVTSREKPRRTYASSVGGGAGSRNLAASFGRRS